MDDQHYAELDAASQEIARQETARDRTEQPLSEQIRGLSRDLLEGLADSFGRSPHSYWSGDDIARILRAVKARL